MEDEQLLLEEEKEFQRTYRFSLWWVEHRAMVRRVLFSIGFGVCGLFLAFAAWTFFDSFVVSFEKEQTALMKMVVEGQSDLRAYSVEQRAYPIQIQTVRVFGIGNQRSDFYAQLVNPNDDWWVRFDYQFVHASGATDLQQGFLLPGQEKPVVALAMPTPVPLQNAQLELSNIAWYRVDHTMITDYKEWEHDRLFFEIENPTYTQETDFTGTVFGRTTFTVKNQTAFGYHNATFLVLLKLGSGVVGVHRALVSSLGAGEQQEVVLNWFGLLPSVMSVEVIPDVDVFDPKVYQRIEGVESLDTRRLIQTR